MWFPILVPFLSFFLLVDNEDRKLYSSASSWWDPLILPVVVAGSLFDGDNTEISAAPDQFDDSPSEDLEPLRREE